MQRGFLATYPARPLTIVETTDVKTSPGLLKSLVKTNLNKTETSYNSYCQTFLSKLFVKQMPLKFISPHMRCPELRTAAYLPSKVIV